MEHLKIKAELLTEEMLPYIQKFKNKIFVIKYGGNAMVDDEAKESVMKDIALLLNVGIKPVIVHGGGPHINAAMQKQDITPVFKNGLRVTDDKTMAIICDVFHEINREIRNILANFSVNSIEINDCLIAKQKDKHLGRVGTVIGIMSRKINTALNNETIPVISSIGLDETGNCYNVNADTAATKIAVNLSAEKLTILTNVNGVSKKSELISHLTIDYANDLIKQEIITGGMIPKVEACIEAVQYGCRKAHLINGIVSHSLLFEIFTNKGVGTEIVKE